MTTHELLVKARDARRSVAALSSEKKRGVLYDVANAVLRHENDILNANETDIRNASQTIAPVMIDRLKLDHARLNAICGDIIKVADLDDPCGKVLENRILKSGIKLRRVSVPIGVIAMIYESRPNVTCDAATLCFKSGNVCVLRGGKEAIETNKAIVSAIRNAIADNGVDPNAVCLVEDITRQSATELMEAAGYVDLLIPRGSAGLINACVEHAKVPCIQTGAGICHVYIDKCADIKKALDIIENAKTSRPSVCNAAEVCLVHKDIADIFLPLLYDRLCVKREENGLVPVELRLDEKAAAIIDGKVAGENDFDTEFLNYILAVKVVDSVEQAVEHISNHSTFHSECIVTEDEKAAAYFTANVDSAAVYVNASTRFTDGGEFGFGCEIGISTQKMHARGPMGLDALTSYKYILTGNGQTR
ncbi:MAG: glutamate-5-semialdehyde dehydrogenase [Clostridia bacterium]|nr:glutamate-5-semialdehyde dehydrogenase [Clostridia bacterium]